MPSPLDDLLATLGQPADDSLPATLDFGRAQRKGVPEVVLAEGKRPEDVVAIVGRFLAHTGRAIVSRADPALVEQLAASFPECAREQAPYSRTLVLRRGEPPPRTGGRVGIITAGTADVPYADEARVVAEEMGCEVLVAYDVGVAGLHRLIGPLRTLLATPVDVIIVAAGMDGALPSVVSGLVDVPVIGLPTPIGYGHGGAGEGALTTMLQTCSPGIAVVNIGNGVGAGATAALIANRVARARAGALSSSASAQPLPHAHLDARAAPPPDGGATEPTRTAP